MTLVDFPDIPTMDGARSGKRKPYQAHHPQAHHHRRVRAQPEMEMEAPEPEIQIFETIASPESEGNPNDPFEQHFLAASLAAPRHNQSPDGKIRSSSFRNDKPKPTVNIRRDSADLATSSNYSSSPNLLFPKDGHAHQRSPSPHPPREGDAPLRRVRSFKTTSKGGLVNRGDSFRKKNSSRNLAAGSLNGHGSQNLAAAHSAVQHSHTDIEVTPTEEPTASYFKVQLIGAPGCGKTSITNQFMSSDYANAYDSMNGK